MRRALPSLPVFVQVGLLVVLSIVAAMGVAFALLLNAPPPAQPGFTLEQAVDALSGRPVTPPEGENFSLNVTVADTTPLSPTPADDPLALSIAQALGFELGLEPEAVRVRVLQAPRARFTWSSRQAAPAGEEPPHITVTDGASRNRTIVIRRSETTTTSVPPAAATTPDPPSAPPAAASATVSGSVDVPVSVSTAIDVPIVVSPTPTPPAPPPPPAGGRPVSPPAPPAPPAPPSPPTTTVVAVAVPRAPLPEPATAAPAPPTTPSPPSVVVTEDFVGPGSQRFTIVADQLRFPPFAASIRQVDGRWATVSPPMQLWSPWHTRILISFLASLALLAPLAWWIARGVTRPIRSFAAAAERLGADPHAPPLAETGPSEVRHAAHAFNEMQGKLNRYVEGRTHMVAAIAHDLRTPLTRLRFRAEQAQPEVRDRLAADIEQMDRMIGQALAYVRGETVRDARVPLDLGALVASVVDDLAEIGADATVEAADGVQVEGESLNLRRAIGNLVENAIKFGGSASVAVTTEGGVAVVAVSDTGPGLPAGELDSVFEPFQRGEKSRNRDTGGTGLGLAVARGIARAHGGDVVLSNRLEGGLTARLTLPTV